MKKTILLIDDDRDIHVRTKMIIEGAGYQFYSAMTGLDGVEAAKQFKPTLIILDYCMPGQDGLTTYKHLSKQPELQNVPVVMLSAATHSNSEIKAILECGINARLQKPFGPRELLNVVENILVINEINIKNHELRLTLERSKDFLQNLVDSCPVVILTADLQGRIKYANKPVKEILGYEPDELPGMLLSTIFGEVPDQAPWRQSSGKRLQEGVVEYEVQTKGGWTVPLGLTFSHLLDFNSNVLGILAIGQDLSAKKQLEKELLEKERLRAITDSLATINHKINNPLTPILGNIQLIRQDESQFAKGHREKLETIEVNARKICEVIKSFNRLTNPTTQTYYGNANLIEV